MHNPARGYAEKVGSFAKSSFINSSTLKFKRLVPSLLHDLPLRMTFPNTNSKILIKVLRVEDIKVSLQDN